MSVVDKMIGYNQPNEYGWRLFKPVISDYFWFCPGGGNEVNGCTPDAATTVMSHTVPVTGVWYCVTAVKTSGHIAIYVNGVLEGTSNLPPDAFFVASNTALLVGANADEGAPLSGEIAEVQLYRSALSKGLVRALYQFSKARLGF